MGATVVDLADSVVTAINANDWSALNLSFSAERLLAISTEITSTLKVQVVPRAVTSEIRSRAASDHDYTIDVVVHQHLTTPEVDGAKLMELCQQIRDLFYRQKIDSPAAHCIRAEWSPIAATDEMKANKYLSMVSLTYRGLA